jgi:hypothetical protein
VLHAFTSIICHKSEDKEEEGNDIEMSNYMIHREPFINSIAQYEGLRFKNPFEVA